MSPEHDGKLFRVDSLELCTPMYKAFFHAWSQIPGDRWNGTPMFPPHLTSEDHTVAKTEYQAIPEFFYSTYTTLPVITPRNAKLFVRIITNCLCSFYNQRNYKIRRKDFSIALWSWCAGSSRLTSTMSGLPFMQCVLFPVDLRYGWDLRFDEHQRLLRLVDDVFKPYLTTMEPRCKYWSRAGSRRDAEITSAKRDNERPMIKFMTLSAIHQVDDRRHSLFENPVGSAMFNESPMVALISHPSFKDYVTNMCQFSGEPDGRRSKKPTKLRSSLKLVRSIRTCKCTRGHIHLHGYDLSQHKVRTAAAALYSRKFCASICHDIVSTLSSSNTSTKSLTHFTNYPADGLFDDEEETVVVPAASPPPAPDDIRGVLNNMDVSSLKFEPGTSRNFLNTISPQLLKACLMDLMEHVLSFGIPGLPTGRLFQHPLREEPPRDKVARFFAELLQPLFRVTGLAGQAYRTTLFNFGFPGEVPGISQDRLNFQSTADGKYHIDLDLDWDLLPDNTRYKLRPDTTFVIMTVGKVTEDGIRQVVADDIALDTTRRRLRSKTAPPPAYGGTPAASEQPAAAARLPTVADEPASAEAADQPGQDIVPFPEESITVHGRPASAIRPHIDFKNLPQKLVHSNTTERDRLLRAVHERFWHCPPADMIRLLQAALLPREIVLRGAEIARDCKECQKFAQRIHRPLIRSHLAQVFNEVVQHDLFFLWDQTFILLIDEALRWKAGDHIANKLGPTIVRAFYYLWIRIWGPMQNILSDQEGGLLSTEATRMCDNLGIQRLLVGKDGATTKGLIERHISLTKFAMLKLDKAAKTEGLIISHSELCQEVCMAQNLLLEYDGGSPQTALTGLHQRGWYGPDSDSIESAMGSMSRRPDFIETMVRTRMLARQCIMEGLIQERLSKAARIRQHKHEPELLVPGAVVDYWRNPGRKDQDGWRGPAELINSDRRAGSAIVKHQGQPLIIPFRHLRRHVLLSFFNYGCLFFSNASDFEDYCNQTLVKDLAHVMYYENFLDKEPESIPKQVLHLMDLVDGASMGKLIWLGIVWRNDEWIYQPDKETVEQSPVLLLARQVFRERLPSAHGVMFGTSLRRVPRVDKARWILILRWDRSNRMRYHVALRRPVGPLTFKSNSFENWSTLILYSYDHHEELEDDKTPDVDLSDISTIPFVPDDDDNDSNMPTPLRQDSPRRPSPPSLPPLRMNEPAPDNDVLPSHSPLSPSPLPPTLPQLNDHNNDQSIDDDISDLQPVPEYPPGLPPGPPAPPAAPISNTIPQPDEPMSEHQPLSWPLPDTPTTTSRRPFRDTQSAPASIPTPSTPATTPAAVHLPEPILPTIDDESIDHSRHSHDLDRTRTPTKIKKPRSTDTSMERSYTRQPSQPSSSTQPPTSTRPSSEPPRTSTKRDEDKLEHTETGPQPKQPRQSSPAPPDSHPEAASSSSAAHQPLLPIVNQDNDTAQSSVQDDTLPYDDQDVTQHYDDPDATHHYDDQDISQHNNDDNNKTLPTDEDLYAHRHYFSHEWENQEQEMIDTFATLFEDCDLHLNNFIKTQPVEYLVDLTNDEIFRVDDSTALLTDDDLARYAQLVREADRRELEAFIDHKVFKVEPISSLSSNANLVDCVWIRKWAIKGQKVKSRMCARGCFDRQKYFIDRHSSTATRLSQRLVVSLGLCTGIIYSDTGDNLDIDTESLDISTAFLQGLDYQQLKDQARLLGYEYRQPRDVHVLPPENVWFHFRSMRKAPSSFKIPDRQRHKYALKCLRAMYGFADAPLMFQLALIAFLKDTTGAKSSVFDDNFLFWYQPVHGIPQLVLVMTVHVDDLQITGSAKLRQWIHGLLEKRFGTLKRQRLPYTHAGIQLERISPDCIRLHQDSFTSKLVIHKLDKDRTSQPDADCTSAETTIFRSLTCSAAWACQTRLEEIFNVVSLQTKLKHPKIQDLIAINTVTKRLAKNQNKFGIYLRRMHPPFRLISVSDASAPNKVSNFATEGIIIGLAEDRLRQVTVDKNDYLEPSFVKHIGGKCHIYIATSQKSKRISYSTSHAETLSAAKAIPVAQLVAMRLSEPELTQKHSINKPLLLQELQDTGQCPIPVDAYIDCMDLWELCCGMRGTPQDKSQRLGILAIREERRSLRLRRLYHIRTHVMLADYLTKTIGADSKSLLELTTSGIWTIDGDIRVRQGFGSSQA